MSASDLFFYGTGVLKLNIEYTLNIDSYDHSVDRNA